MATQTDLLKTLPPELRQYIYSYLFPGDENGTIRIRQHSQAERWDSAILALSEDHVYLSRRRSGVYKGRWLEKIDEAFFQALRWASKEHAPSRLKVNGTSFNEIISRLVFEFTGQETGRKSVSARIQVLKGYLQPRHPSITEWAHANLACEVIVPNSDLPSELSQSSSCPWNTVSRLKETSPTRYETPYAQDLLSLSLVNRFYRIECSDHLASNIPLDFDFASDGPAFRTFCRTAPAALINMMRHVRITLVEGYMPPFLPRWPNLATLALDLCPRYPARSNVKDRQWGVQTEELLARLGVTVAARARITVEMRGADDCERFEQEYVGRRRRRRVAADVAVVENDALDQEEREFCRRSYERCGDWEMGPEVTGNEIGSASTLGLSCLLKISRCCYE